MIRNCLHILILLLGLSFFSGKAQQSAMPDLNGIFTELAANEAVFRVYQDSMYMSNSRAEWEPILRRRAKVFREMYHANNRSIDLVKNYFSQDPSLIPDAAFDSLLVNVQVFSHRSSDIFLIEEFCNLLLPHYEAVKDTLRVCSLYRILGYVCLHLAHSYEPEMGARSVEYYNRIIEQGDFLIHHGMKGIAPLLNAFHDNMIYHVSHGFNSSYEAYRLYQEYKRLEQTSYVQEDSIAAGLFQKYRLRYEEVAFDRALSRAQKAHFKLRESFIDTLSILSLGHHYAPPVADDPETSFRKMCISFDSLCGSVMLDTLIDGSSCRVLADTLSLRNFDDFMEQAKDWMEQYSYICKERQKECKEMNDSLVQLILHASRVTIVPITDYSVYDGILSDLAKNPYIHSYLGTPERRERFMIEVGVKQQVGTVNHVSMVEQLCWEILSSIIEHRPSLLVGLMGYADEQSVRSHRRQLMHYMSYAALFHDLGKNSMADIVNNDFRRLFDHEYAILKKHPVRAIEYLGVDSTFTKYRDIALGHHRWYNGSGGYPESFDNVASPYRVLIDLLTLCDCIDAATDFYCRNYRDPKTVDSVIAEFCEQKGTRYNPDIVEYIAGSPQLIERINAIVTTERADLIERVRRQYIR